MINKKKLLLVLVLGAMVALAGCAGFNNSGEDTEGAKNLSNDTSQEINIEGIGDSYYYEVGITEENQQNLVRAQPPFQMENSLERQNLIERYKHLNDQNNIHHVYLMSHDGKVIAYFTAQGKVSSVNSKLTNDKQIVEAANCEYDGSGGAGSEGPCYKTVESPQMDGSYGSNGDGIFFFTTEGQYVEWNGLYVVSEEAQQINTEVSLVQQVDENGNVVTGENDTAENEEGS